MLKEKSAFDFVAVEDLCPSEPKKKYAFVTQFWKTRTIAQKSKFELLVALNSSTFAEQNGS